MDSHSTLKSDQLPIINIITRTSKRPLFFGDCQQSIQIQSYQSDRIRRYVTFDDETDLEGYIQKYNNLVVMEMEREKRKNQTHFPYHGYLNEVVKYIGETCPGWVMILDDDNQLAKQNSLEILAKYIVDGGNDPQKFYLWKCQQGDRIVPSCNSFSKVPKTGDLHISCFSFHHNLYGYPHTGNAYQYRHEYPHHHRDSNHHAHLHPLRAVRIRGAGRR